VTTYFVGNHYEVTNGVVTKYYFAGATRLAVRTNGTLSYLLGDHLGSSSVTTNASGVKTASALYKAFGETRYSSGALGTDYKFTGQREQAELGLYFYGARWYDSSLGRFTSPDTMIPSTQGVQAWDRYAYVNNNPAKYNDPTGHDALPWNTFIIQPSAFLRTPLGGGISFGIAIDLRPFNTFVNYVKTIGSPTSVSQLPQQVGQLLNDINGGVFVQGAVTAGAEVGATAGVAFKVTTTTMEDIDGTSTLADELNVHGVVCDGLCLGAEAADNNATPNEVDTAGIYIGAGPPGGGIGVDLGTTTDWALWGSGDGSGCAQVPFTDISTGDCP